MENWGAITYLTDLVYKNEKTPKADQQVVVRITSHEVNHQWFGNLVTCRWWDDLWLNEGFTRYIDFVAADYLHPEWNMVRLIANFKGLVTMVTRTEFTLSFS